MNSASSNRSTRHHPSSESSTGESRHHSGVPRKVNAHSNKSYTSRQQHRQQQNTLPGFLPGAASLVEQLDKRTLFVLRDGRHLVGVLRSFDQFSNCVLEDCSERRFLVRDAAAAAPGGRNAGVFTDIPLGLYLVRGDSVVLLGELNPEERMDRVGIRGVSGMPPIESLAIAGSRASHGQSSLHRVTQEQFDQFEEEGENRAASREEIGARFVRYTVNWDFE